MRNRYVQIALTYTMPWPLRIWAVGTMLALLWMCIMWLVAMADFQEYWQNPSYPRSGTQATMLMLGGVLAAWAGAMVVGHAKEQIANHRSALVPGYRPPHLLVAAGAFVTVVVLLASLVFFLATPRLWDAASWPGYLALVLVVTAGLAWMTYLQSPMAVVLLMLMVTPVWFDVGRSLLNDIVRGRADDVAFVLLAITIAALLGLWWRMALLHAEMPEYSRTAGPGFRLRVQMTGDPGFRRESAADAGALEAWVRHASRLDDVANVAAAGFWRRVRHWRIVIGLGRTPLLIAVLLGLWSFILPILVGGVRDKGARLVLPISLSVLMPGVIAAATWPRRWYTLGNESLRPVSRRQFVHEQGAAMALDMAMSWLTITGALFAAALLLEPGSIFRSPLWQPLPIVIAAQILNFGVIVWIMRYRSWWLVIAPIFLTTFVGIGVLIIGGALTESGRNQSMLIASVIFAAAGVGITIDAYRRWLTTEFD